jgi:hypothetical protein
VKRLPAMPKPYEPVAASVWLGIAAIAAVLILGLSQAAGLWVAAADPDQQPPPFVPGTVIDCAGHPVPLDPRVSVREPLGTLFFEDMLKAICGALPPAPSAPPIAPFDTPSTGGER